MTADVVAQKKERLKAIYGQCLNPPKPNKSTKPFVINPQVANMDKMLSYIMEREVTGFNKDTIINDLKALIEFSKVCRKPLNELTTGDILNVLVEYNNRSPSSVRLYKIKLKGFFTYIKRKDLADFCKVKRQSASSNKLPEDLLSQADIEKLITASKTPRDKAYIALLYESGARRGELQELQWKHITFDDNGAVVTLPKGKTGARRIRVVFSAGYLQNWLDNHPLKDNREAWVWASSRDPTVIMAYRTIWGNLKRTAKRAGIQKNVFNHLFRHSRATHLAKSLTEQQLKTYLGWAKDSPMASVYVHLSGEDLDPAILKLNGIQVEEREESNSLKVIKCPRCKELQDHKAQFCFKCGLPLTTEATNTENTAQAELLKLIESSGMMTELVKKLQSQLSA